MYKQGKTTCGDENLIQTDQSSKPSDAIVNILTAIKRLRDYHLYASNSLATKQNR
jgi:hypothetical protein